jgi:hypothetical protein
MRTVPGHQVRRVKAEERQIMPFTPTTGKSDGCPLPSRGWGKAISRTPKAWARGCSSTGSIGGLGIGFVSGATLTRSFKELVQKRVASDPAFGEALLREDIDSMPRVAIRKRVTSSASSAICRNRPASSSTSGRGQAEWQASPKEKRLPDDQRSQT